jgi:hypothetical protein
MKQYKTLTLQLLRQYPSIHNQLKDSRILSPVLDHYSKELKKCHEAWMDSLSESKPGSDPSQIGAEAMELALQEVEDRLPSELPPDGSASLTLDGAIAYLRKGIPPA